MFQSIPAPTVSAMGGEQEVEGVVGRRVGRSGGLEYQLAWKGWGPEHSTWEPADSLANCAELVKQWEAEHAETTARVVGGPGLTQVTELGTELYR